MENSNKDLNLKLLCKLLFKKMGYVTHFEIKLRNKSYISAYKSHDISDIDVLGYSFNPDLSYFTVGSECKSGETGALDEFYKFLGISKYCKLDKAYLIKTKIHQNARQIASQNNFVCLSEAELRKMLAGFEIDVDKHLKIEHAKLSKRQQYFSSYKSRNEKLIEYIELDFWNKEDWKNVHNLLHRIKPVAQDGNIFPEVDIVHKFIYYNVCELFSYSLLKLFSESITLNYADFDSAFVSSLYGGAEALHEKRKIQDAVNIASQQNKQFEPEWQQDLQQICSRMSNSTLSVSLIPSMIQDIYENCFFPTEVKIDNRIVKKYPDHTRKFIQDLMQFMNKNFDIHPAIFSEFMSL